MANPYHDEIGRFTDAEGAAFRMPSSLLTEEARDEIASGLTKEQAEDLALDKASEQEFEERQRSLMDRLRIGAAEPKVRPLNAAFEDTLSASGRQNVAVARQALSDVGFPPENVEVLDNPRRWSMGGETFQEGAHYDPTTGKIRITSDSLLKFDETELTRLMRHEASHDAWHRVSNMGSRDATPQVRTFQNSLALITGKTREAIEEEDGVSEYSRAHWRHYDEARSGAWVGAAKEEGERVVARRFTSALNETLAEMQASNVVSGRYNPKPNIERLHKELQAAYASIDKSAPVPVRRIV